jgi:hypothetical protein
MFGRSALEAGMIHSNITANCACNKVIKSQLIKLAVDMGTCFENSGIAHLKET